MTKIELIDEYGELDRQIAAFKPVVERHKTLKQTIAGWFEDQPAESCSAEGRLYRVEVSPRASERRIPNMRKLYRLIGVSRFLDWCTFPLAALDKLVSDQHSVVEISQTGPRKVVPILKAPAKKAA